MLIELNTLFANPDHQFLHHYVTRLANAAGIADNQEEKSSLSTHEVAFLGHLIAYLAYFHRVDIFAAPNTSALLAAYHTFKQDFPEQQDIAGQYAQACRNQKAVTPTYVPGVLDTLLGLCKFHVDSKASDQAATLPSEIDCVTLFKAHPENAPLALQTTIPLMCQLLHAIYKTGLNQRISCMTLAKASQAKTVLESWLRDRHTV